MPFMQDANLKQKSIALGLASDEMLSNFASFSNEGKAYAFEEIVSRGLFSLKKGSVSSSIVSSMASSMC
jgi:hypothetical protein